ncbi:hypothetical protein [Hallella multisaccharivorax]|uniref:hypothetical protein n=1 Tax=Hallella multisaccharivorax TaxID=310514 RepID=UPI003621CA88
MIRIKAVLRIKDKETFSSKYLMIWFLHPEFDRYARFHSIGMYEKFSVDMGR